MSTSTDLICEFLRYAISGILHSRGFYCGQDYAEVFQFGLKLFVPYHPELVEYMEGLMKHLYHWIDRTDISELQFTILDGVHAPAEKYTFEFIVTDEGKTPKHETYRTIKNSLHALMMALMERPPLVGEYSFVIQVKEHAGSAIPREWFNSNEQTGPHPDVQRLPTAFIFEAGIKLKVYTFSGFQELNFNWA